MPTDIPPLTYGTFYHIYNRGNNHENIFVQERNYEYFLKLWWKHVSPVADTCAYCLLRNHFHIVVHIKNREDLIRSLTTDLTGFGNLSGLEEIMGDALVQRMLPSFEKIPLPASAEATSLGRTTYEVGIEKVNNYQNDPKVLAEALRTFQTGDSQPYFFAGLAYTLLAAAREADGSYAQSGVEAAMGWLEKAQALAPDELEINMIEALVYIYSGRFEDARLILDYLEEQDPNCFYLMEAEVAFWQMQGNPDETIQAYEKAIKEAANVPQRLRMQNRLGDFYLAAGMLDKALAVYREAVHFDKDNPWLWHSISLTFFKLKNLEEAARANKRTLSLLDFPEARRLEQEIRGKMDTGGLRRLFGR